MNSNQKPIINETENAATENITAETTTAETTAVETTFQELNLKISELETKISSLENELTTTKQNERDTALRAKAEIENMRRRTELEIEKNHKFAIEKFATALLPVIDSLERAIELINPNSEEAQSMQEGLELTLSAFSDTLNKFNIIIVDENNIPFDPSVHEAMTIIESKDHETNHVVSVMQKGYTLNGRLLRPARVTIAK